MERSRHEQPGFPRRVGATRRVYTDNLFRDVPPLKSIDDPDAAGVFEVDEELDEFLANVRADHVLSPLIAVSNRRAH